jgi:hypothetical protein
MFMSKPCAHVNVRVISISCRPTYVRVHLHAQCSCPFPVSMSVHLSMSMSVSMSVLLLPGPFSAHDALLGTIGTSVHGISDQIFLAIELLEY